MHSLGHRSLEETGYLATPASVTAELYAALAELASNTIDVGHHEINTHRAQKALELAGKVLHECQGTCNGTRLPIDSRTRQIPPHRDGRGRSCSYVGALLSRAEVDALSGYRAPQPAGL